MNQENLGELSNKADLLTNNNLVGNNKSAKSDSSHEKTINGTHDTLDDINRRTGRNMPQAIATAILLVAVIVACLVISIDTFVILLTIFMVLALWELHVDFATAGFRIPFLVLSVCSVITILSAFYTRWHAVAMASGITASLLLTVVFATLNSTVSQRTLRAVEKKLQHPTSSKSAKANTFTNTAVSLFVVLYIPLLASCIVLSLTNTKYAIAHAMLLVFLPALSDTGGLFAGAWLGKHKLSPRISPKKSIEGLLGSMLFALIGAYAIISGFYGSSWIKFWWMPAIMGVASGMVGTFGDLCASMLKRDIGIKDMGHLLKGHGGVLDRVDSILLCAPVLMALIKVVGF